MAGELAMLQLEFGAIDMIVLTTKDEPVHDELIQRADLALELQEASGGDYSFKVIKRRVGDAGIVVNRRNTIRVLSQALDDFVQKKISSE